MQIKALIIDGEAKENDMESNKYTCTICGGDASVSFKGFFDEFGLDEYGNKNPFTEDDRSCLPCLYKLTKQKLF